MRGGDEDELHVALAGFLMRNTYVSIEVKQPLETRNHLMSSSY